jgi:hypothetical protein
MKLLRAVLGQFKLLGSAERCRQPTKGSCGDIEKKAKGKKIKRLYSVIEPG